MNKNYTIPPIIKKLQPKLRDKDYFTLIKNPGFLEKIAFVCENCYLLIINSTDIEEVNKKE